MYKYIRLEKIVTILDSIPQVTLHGISTRFVGILTFWMMVVVPNCLAKDLKDTEYSFV
jgi:hypothetical protein